MMKPSSSKTGDTLFRRILSFPAVLLLVLASTCGLLHLIHSVRSGLNMGGYSDASRQWEVCQYVKARINPYALADQLLQNTFGPATGPDRILLKEHRIYSISSANWDCNTPGILPGHPPPEATYPPSTLSLLMPCIGFLPWGVLLPVSSAANLLALILLILLLTDWIRKSTGLTPLHSVLLVSAICLCWPPLAFAVQNGQPGIPVLLSALLFAGLFPHRPILAGFMLMLALVKPSMCLLFAFMPLVRWRWRPLWTTFFLGVVLTVLPCLWLGEWPWVILAQWMDLCRYVLQGAFTLQEVFNAFALENTLWSTALVFLLWGAVLVCCIRFRQARWEWHFAFLALANLAWTYHERHDFVLLVFPILLFAADAVAGNHRRLAVAGLLLSLFLGAGLSDFFYVPDAPWAHLVRWVGRVALLGLWPVTLARLTYSAREDSPSVSVEGIPAAP